MTETELQGGLLAVAGLIKRWLEWDCKHRENNRPPLTTDDGTHIMALPVPFWPSHGQFEHWIKLFEGAAQALGPAQEARKPSAWRACWVSLNTSRSQLFEIEAEATTKARETGGCVIPLYAAPAQAPTMPPSLRSELIQLEAIVHDARCSNEVIGMRIRNTWDTFRHAINSTVPSTPSEPAQEVPERGSLTRLAAECHRSKWQFDLSEDYKPTARVARDMILRAFRELHRIGDLAMKLRDASPLPSTIHQSHPVWEDENRWMCNHGKQGGCSCRFACKGYGALSSTQREGGK